MASAEEPKVLAYTTLAIAAVPLALIAISRLVSPKIDPREPPPLWPTVPLVGHIISLLREHASFYSRLFKEKAFPICTLPMLNGKIYVINSPGLVSAAMKSPDVSFEPFFLELSAGAVGLRESELDMLRRDGNLDKFMNLVHNDFKGTSLAKLNVAALTKLAETLDAVPIGEDLVIPDVWLWLRDVLIEAVTSSLFGEHNPFNEELHADVWKYEEGIPLLAQGLSFAARGPLAARKRINKALEAYYEAHYDEHESVSDIMRNRAALSRQVGTSSEALGILEFIIPWVGSTNTVPTFLWYFLNVFSRPDLVERIRAEVEAFVTIAPAEGGKGRVVTIDASTVEKRCPVVTGSYRETLRVYVHNLGMRRVLRETTLRDPDSGREYLLRKGVDIQWMSGVTHRLSSVWGESSEEFESDRFVNVSTAEDKKRRGAYIPFGGGKHLCPGRNFALAENLGFLAALAVAFDVEGAWVPESDDPYMGTATRRPIWGDGDKGLRLRRRPGWEDVTWNFVS
ncbi:cytochrome P450 [Plectosphaerella plurivora]|uniref:Cytochrome P450 n=1 Tax=Plectosphaerella plurivora TaxID=936078 RepID=A0A9P9AAZ2_9PEZI|nr:cytochrome P450 [Plectosphaerella plurivora]